MTEIISTGCPHDCGGQCILKVHVQDGKITKITTAHDPEFKACVKGLSYLERFNSPDRLKYPLRRVGKRGEGKFERISWDEALDTLSGEMKRVKSSYGNSAFLLYDLGGENGQLYMTYGCAGARLFNMFGGCTRLWSLTSFEGSFFATQYTFGLAAEGNWGPVDSNEFDDLLNSRFIILWGCDPSTSIWSTSTRWFLMQAKEKGIKIISIDPKFTESAASWASSWIPIRPGTDTAMLAAIAYVIIKENLEDQVYLDKYTTGFKVFKDYILGAKDGVPKTPEWAEKITGVPISTIEKIARMYATTKPSAILQGWAPGRTSFGEEFHRMVITLEAMTGNIGVHGGSAGNLTGYPVSVGALPTGENPIDTSIKRNKWADCILLGKAGGYPSDIKMMYVVGSNPLNNTENINKSIKALGELEFLAVHEQFMTPTAKFADMVLPVTTHFERNDIYVPYMRGRYVIYSHKVCEPMYECKSDLEIFTELAKRLGITGYNTKTEDEWLRSFIEESDIPDYDEFKKKGFYKFEVKEPWIAFKKQIDDPDNNPFPTPSGKIEIYSETLAKMDFEKTKYGS
ncbi:molybdopterin-dependent oxidoreductase, partial [Chloroflexota bacterium]